MHGQYFKIREMGRSYHPPEDDVSGRKAIEMVERKGYACSYMLVPDDRDRIRSVVEKFMEKE